MKKKRKQTPLGPWPQLGQPTRPPDRPTRPNLQAGPLPLLIPPPGETHSATDTTPPENISPSLFPRLDRDREEEVARRRPAPGARLAGPPSLVFFHAVARPRRPASSPQPLPRLLARLDLDGAPLPAPPRAAARGPRRPAPLHRRCLASTSTAPTSLADPSALQRW